jgi:uncharacterized membrane protein
MDKTPLTVVLLLAAVAAYQFWHYYPDLPKMLATHFGVSGQADGWSDKGVFVLTYGLIEAALVLGAFLTARFGMRIPTGSLNMPNKDYWLAEERREESLRFVWNKVLWIEAATLAYLIVIAEIIFRANLAPGPPTLGRDFFVALIAFVVVMGWMCVHILVRFRLPVRR